MRSNSQTTPRERIDGHVDAGALVRGLALSVALASLVLALFATPAQATIVYISQSSGSNDALPTDGTAGSLTIPIPSGVSAGRALIASIAARPRSMTVTVPSGWILMTSTDQPAGGVSTAPGGMTLLTYYKIATASEPASYTWTFANPVLGQGGSAVGGILTFSGVDTSASPIDVWSARLTPNGTTHATNSITPTVTNTMIVSSISFLSSSTFGNPTGIAGITERLDVAAPPPNAAIGTTLQMSTAPWATTTATGASQAVAASNADTGVGHLMALRPSNVDLAMVMVRSGPLIPGGSATYTLTVTNSGSTPESGPLTVVDTLPTGLTFASSSGSGWSCGVSAPVVTCTRAGALTAGASAPDLILNVNVSAGASGTLTNTATVSGTDGDANLANNTAVDSYTIPIPPGGFCDNFENGMGNWLVDTTGGGDAGIGSQTALSPSNSLFLRWNTVSVTSQVSDLSAVTGGSIQYWVRRGADSFSEDPDNNEDLVVEYFTSTATWQVLETLPGNGTPGEQFTRNFPLPADARHAQFQLRFRYTSGSGADFDYWHVDDVCFGSATFPQPAPYAYYAMDETTWGTVIDSSGNGRDGTVLSAAAPTGFPPPSPPGSAIPGDPGTCGAGAIPVTAGAGVDTGIDIDSLGNAGSITLWYSSNTVWDDNNDRMLLDASNDLGNGNADKHFYLVKGDRGEIRFGLEDDTDDNERVDSSQNSFPANEWHHIAITWDWNASNEMRLYLDGVLVDSEPINDNIGNYATLYLGTTHGGISGTDTDFTTNTANGYLDEVRVYAAALTAAQITADMNATHSCVAIDHFAINIGAAAASTCAAKSITITAQDVLNATVTGYTGTINIATSSGHGDWSQPTVTGTLVNGAADDGAASYTFVAADNGVKILDLTNHHADNLTISVVDSALAATLSTSATINFRDNAFVITPDPIQVAGRDQATGVALWRRDLSTGNCAIATGYTGAKNLDAWITRDASDPNGTAPTIGALSLPSVAPAINPGSNNLSLTFVNGSASFNLATTDVGKYALNLRDDTRLFATGVDISGATSTITTRPFALHVTVAGNPGATLPTQAVFTSAGTNFTATARGVLWQLADDANNDGVPNVGADFSDNGVTPSYAWATTLSAIVPFTPATGVLGTLSNGSIAQASFSGGAATPTNLQYTEVGSFTLQAAATSFLNSAGVDVTTANGVVGRFVPARYAAVASAITPACTTSPPGFSYARQPFSGTMTIEAQNAGGTRTANFRDGFDKLDPATELTFVNDQTAGPYNDKLVSFAPGATFSDAPTGSANLDLQFRWDMPLQAPVDTTVQLSGAIGEVTTVAGAPVSIGATNMRFGRLVLKNVFGSELLPLSMSMNAEYYFDAATGFVTNGGDGCTAVSTAELDLSNNIADPPLGTPTITTNIGPPATTTVSVVNNPFVGGVGGLTFSVPGNGGDGYADISVNLTSIDWLRFDWDGGGANDDDPSARATFGIYKGSPRQIYLRERH